VESVVDKVSNQEDVIVKDKLWVVINNAQESVKMSAVSAVDQVLNSIKVYVIVTEINSIVMEFAEVMLLKTIVEFVEVQVCLVVTVIVMVAN